MNITAILNSYPGMYVTQSFFHAFIGTIITSAAIETWRIDSPLVRQRFRLSVILFSIFSFPLYQAINPERGGLFFRLDAVFDSSRWLELELWGVVPVYLFFIGLILATTAVFLLQEMGPILRHFIEPPVDPHMDVIKPAEDSPVGRALQGIPAALPEVFLVPDEDIFLFSSIRGNVAIYISTGLIKKFTAEEIQASVSHELAHISRSRYSVLLAGFILRTLMFFNPVVLVEFRRAIRNEEKICDDIAVSVTGNPAALAGALKKLYSVDYDEEPDVSREAGPSPQKISLDEYSFNLQLEARIARLEHWTGSGAGNEWFPMFISFAAVAVINYYVV